MLVKIPYTPTGRKVGKVRYISVPSDSSLTWGLFLVILILK